MAKIKVCAVQFQVSTSFSKNIEKSKIFIKKASKNNCNVICFPEIFLTGPLDSKSYNSSIPNISKKTFSKYCKNYNIYCVMGSIIEKIKGNYYNTSYLINNKGEILGRYLKNHLVQKNEGRYLKPGNKTPVFKTKLCNIGIQICKDLLYPEVTRRLMLNKAQIVFCPSFWAEKSTTYDYIYNHKYFKKVPPREVDSLISARAIESEVIFVYANAAGTYKSRKDKSILLGRSQIALPFYGSVNIIKHNKETILMKKIDLDIVKDAKKIYKIEQDIKNYYNKA